MAELVVTPTAPAKTSAIAAPRVIDMQAKPEGEAEPTTKGEKARDGAGKFVPGAKTEKTDAKVDAKADTKTTPAKVAGDAPEEPKAETDERFAKRFAALSAEDKRVKEGRNQLSLEKEAFSKERKELDDLRAFKREQEENRARAKKEPLRALKALGIEMADVARDVATITPEMERVRELEERLERERKQREDSERAATEARQQASRSAAAQEFQSQIKAHVEDPANEEKYETLRTIGDRALNEIWGFMVHVYKHGDEARGFPRGTELSIDKAAELMEDSYHSEFAAIAKRAKPAGRLRRAFALDEAADEAKSQAQKPSAPTKTVSNSKATTPAAPAKTGPMSRDERKALAISIARKAQAK